MIGYFNALTGFDPLPSSVNVEGGDYSIITDFREWCVFDTCLFDRNVSEEIRGQVMLHMFFPAIAKGELQIVGGIFPFSPEAARDALVDFWTAGRVSSEGKASGAQIVERPYDFVHDAAMIYAAFRQAYGIDLHYPDGSVPLHWWTFYALFSNLPEGSNFATAKAARLSKVEKFPKHMQQAQKELKEAYRLPDHIRYFDTKAGGQLTEAEFLAQIRAKRDAIMRASTGAK